ncbi:MAG: VanZ family protein [Pseudomonadota bacterium]
MLPLRLGRFWAAVGWAGVLAGLVLSLWPGGVPLPVQVWDKIQHATGYFLLTSWFTGFYPRRRYLLIGTACVLLGVCIEGLQALTPTRTAELGDACANAVGVALALVLAYAGLGGWAARVERLLGLAPR